MVSSCNSRLLNRRDAIKLSIFAATSLWLLGLTNEKASAELTNYKLGKAPATPHYGLKLRDYVTSSDLPTVPDTFGHEALVRDWGVLGNDEVGDCAIAGPFHAEMLWCAMGKRSIKVNTKCTLEEYSEITGYDPKAYDPFTNTNPTDNGSNVQDVAEFWRTIGLKDASGKRHKIDCYLALEPGNLNELYQAMYLFGCVGIGIGCPVEFQTAFANGQAWDALPTPHIEGGHYILGTGRLPGSYRGKQYPDGLINVVTWGRNQVMTPAAYQQFNDESFVYLNEEMLVKGKSIDGFDLDQLIADMSDIASEKADIAPQDKPNLPVALV